MQAISLLRILLVKSLYAWLCLLRVPHAAWFVQPNNVWQVKIIKRYTAQFTPASRHFLYLRFKNFSQHCVTEHPRHTFFPFSEGPSSTLTQNNSHNNSRSSTFFVANGKTWFLTNKQYITPRIQSAPNICANTTLIFRNNFKTPAFSEQYLSLCCDFDLHSVQETSTHAQLSQHSLLDQTFSLAINKAFTFH